MTAKRFSGQDIYTGVNEHFQFYDNNKRISNKEVLELLNNLNDENEQLRNDCSILIQSNQDYRKENEQLKAHNQYLIKLLEHTGAIVEIKKGDVE